MDVTLRRALLGGLSPAAFMRRHWQKKPLLVRGAVARDALPSIDRASLFAFAARDDVESRLVVRDGRDWQVRHGPLPRRALPPLARPGWTLLVQGVELHVPTARALLDDFRFVPEVRLDDLMVSWASDGGGVGPHVDSYDVFLLQLDGRRRWRIGPAADRAFVPGLPLKILRRFEPVDDWVLDPGDMLYLPPGWGHDGVAVDGACTTASIGFRAPSAAGLAVELAQRLADAWADDDDAGHAARSLYADPSQAATRRPGAMPAGLLAFAERALRDRLREPGALARTLGEVLTEPKPRVWFPAGAAWRPGQGVRLAPATRIVYDDAHVFVNGESFVAAGRDREALCVLADERRLPASSVARMSRGARETLSLWCEHGWLVAETGSS